MADTYEVFYNGKPLNPNRGLPTMTYAQAEDCGLTESERLWCRTDGEDTQITADDIPYSTGVSVKDKIDWTLLGNFKFADSGTSYEGDWNLTNNVPASCNEICFYITVGSGDVGYMPRNSMVIPYSVFSTYKVFYDFNIGTSRVYLQVERVSDSKFKISNVTFGGLSSPMNIYAYAR